MKQQREYAPEETFVFSGTPTAPVSTPIRLTVHQVTRQWCEPCWSFHADAYSFPLHPSVDFVNRGF